MNEAGTFSGKSIYAYIDDLLDKGTGGFCHFTNRDSTYHREDRDSRTGPEEPIANAINQLNMALSYSWASYGSISMVASGGNFGVGYGDCEGNYGWHTEWGDVDWAGVNPKLCNTYTLKYKFFTEEISELIGRFNDLGGGNSSSLLCDSSGNLNQVGKELLAYIYVNSPIGAQPSFKF